MSDEVTEAAHAAALEDLAGLVAELKEEPCLADMRRLLAEGYPAMELLEACIEGLRRVGTLFEQGQYFIAALIMAGEIMREATELLRPRLGPRGTRTGAGTVLLGTIQGDIHDLGKNLFALLLQSGGFEVVDLGVDVAPETFVARAREVGPDLVGVSCVLTAGLESLKRATARIRAELPEPRPPVIVGGACIDEQVGRYVEADHWARNAADGLVICQRVVAGMRRG